MDAINPLVHRWLRDAAKDPDAFWERAARTLPWLRGWDSVFEWNFPDFRWFSGAETNLAYNCVDRHAQGPDRGRAALVYVNERGDRTVLTYAQLLHEVCKVASALRGMGIQKGDPSDHLHARLRRGHSPDAGYRSHRRHSLRRLRRIRRGSVEGTYQGQRLQARLHHRRHLQKRLRHPAEVYR